MERSQGLREFVVCQRCLTLGFYPLNARQPIVGVTAGGELILGCGHHQLPAHEPRGPAHGPVSHGPRSDSRDGK